MAQYYTKEQMDSLATIIGEKISAVSEVSVENATDIQSFMLALDGIEAGPMNEDSRQYMTFTAPNQTEAVEEL